jgi:predicted phage terminase large subunit-like protein
LDAKIVEFSSGVIKGEWFSIVPYIPPQRPSVRYWDIAATVKTSSDYSAGALCSYVNSKFTVHHMDHGKWEYPDLRNRIVARAKEDGRQTIIAIEAAGQQQIVIDDIKRLPELRDYVIRAISPRGDKYSRAMPWVSRAQLGSVQLCSGHWITAFLSEAEAFSGDMSHEHDDQIDAVSGGYSALARTGSVSMIAI